jgi:hypothetical protein
MPEGQMPPPYAVNASVGLTSDAAGTRWALLTFSDGTMTMSLRIPWQNAPAFGHGVAQGLIAVHQQAQQEAGPQLITPNGGGGRLIVPGGPFPAGPAVRG